MIADALDLRGPDARATLGLGEEALSADPPDLCQRIGEGAVTCGREAILAPSATGLGDALALYVGRLGAGTQTTYEELERWDTPPTVTPSLFALAARLPLRTSATG